MSLTPLRANTLLNAKMEQVQLLVVVEMCAWLSSPRVARGKEEEGERNRRDHLTYIRMRKDLNLKL